MELADAQTILANLVAQYKSLAANPIYSMSINGRSMQRATLEDLEKRIAYWEGVIAELGGNGGGSIALVDFGEAR